MDAGIGIQGLIALEAVTAAGITGLAHHSSGLDGFRIRASRLQIKRSRANDEPV
jgi:hypothetical protein